MYTARWLLCAVVPAALFAALVRRTDSTREPAWLVALTFALGAAGAAGAWIVRMRAIEFTGLDIRVATSGEAGALTFVFLVVAPGQEVGKVAAAWPAFRSKHFDEPYDGVVYATAAALGFAALENAFVLRAHPDGNIWIARAMLALPAHVFFACLWGYALGRAKHLKQRVPLFPAAFLASVILHGLYAHFVYGRGPGALWGVSPLLAVMGFVVWLLGRDLKLRSEANARSPHSAGPLSSRLSRISMLPPPPSLTSVRHALSRANEPVKLRWIVFGALVVVGGMLVGLAAGVATARAFGVDLSTVDEQDFGSTAPVLLLIVGLLASFPVTGWLVTRAAGARTLLEPALATLLALGCTLAALGMAAPSSVVFGLAVSPIAWVLACFGAWIGRTDPIY